MALGTVNRRKQEGHTALTLIRTQSPVKRTAGNQSIKVNIRIRADIWAAFLEVCAESGTTASEEIRGFIYGRIS